MSYGTNGPGQPPPGGWYPPPAGTSMPPGYGHPGYGYGYPPPPPPPPASNTLAVAGFVCSLIGILLAFVPVVGVGAWVLIIIGLVLASIGLARASRGGRRGLAIAGLVLGLVAIPICVVTTVAALASSPWTQTTPEAGAPVSSTPYSPATPSYSSDTGSSSGTAHTATDQIYIGALRAGGIPFSTEDDAIAAAHSTCTMFAQGATIQQQVEQSTNAGYTEYQSGYILGAAVSAYCPEYKSLLHIDN